MVLTRKLKRVYSVDVDDDDDDDIDVDTGVRSCKGAHKIFNM